MKQNLVALISGLLSGPGRRPLGAGPAAGLAARRVQRWRRKRQRRC